MIAIVNIGGDPLGISKYELKINNTHIAFFSHNRPDGLPKCLAEASKAAEKAKWDGAIDMFIGLDKARKDGRDV